MSGGYVTRWLGRHTVFWGGGAGLAVGALALISGRQAIWTLLSVVFMGYAGNLLLISNQAALSDTHGEQRSIALLEANVVASVGASLAPLSLSIFQAAGPGWRSALVLMVGVFLLLVVLLRQIPIPDATAAAVHQAQGTLRLPVAFWAYWVVVLVGVSIEWGIAYWSTDFLVQAGGLSPARAAGWLTVFFIAALIGRFVSSRLARSIPARRLIILAIVIAAAGFVLFWLVPILAFRLGGLVLAGLGSATFYPLGVSLTLGTVPQQADRGSARVALGAGLTGVSVPFLLGAVADQAGLWWAYSIVAVLLLVMISMVTFANHVTRRADA
jgi:fucose permease